jgi:DNA polymerase/3'-5' exonuclease PolX
MQTADGFPINVELVHKMAYLPVKLAELAEKNPTGALELLTAWGKGTKPITHLWNDALNMIAAQ